MFIIFFPVFTPTFPNVFGLINSFLIDELYLTITDAEVPTPTASLELIVKLMTSLDIKLWLVETDTKAEIVSIFPVTC